MINWITIALILGSLLIGVPILFGEPSAINLLLGGGVTLFGVVIFIKNAFEIRTAYKKKSVAGHVAGKVKSAVKKKN